ncbi:acetyltransferase [Desulfurivibrio dismutans]|uniref:acetyltransferase n=1 Tax=Desulfurivibrio dismutans TaxID=1398908 RepID=UPI0023DC2929|nr:acetyltransferase [Desulfurivibrio alkaliphilus]MDF1613505.1 acetyltransferase [Desulfurivibrio alkaliphilus]
MNKLILLGGGGHCKACIDVVEQTGQYTIEGILDPALTAGEKILDCPVLGGDEKIAALANEHLFLISVGQIKTPALRVALAERLRQAGGEAATVVSPRAYVSRHAKVDEGSIVMPGATVNAGARVGRHCIINSHALVEHDAVIGDFCHIATGALINGGVEIGEGSFVGSGSMIREYRRIGAGTFIAAGLSIYHDLPAGSVIKPPQAAKQPGQA